MDKLEITKKAVSLVVGLGVSKIVKGFIENNTSAESVTDKVAIASAAVVIGSMSAAAVKNHADTMIDDAIAAYKKIRDEIKGKYNTEMES